MTKSEIIILIIVIAIFGLSQLDIVKVNDNEEISYSNLTDDELIERSNEALKKGEYEDCYNLCDYLISERNLEYPTNNLRVRLFMDLGNFDEAINIMNNIEKNTSLEDPKLAIIYSNKSSVLHRYATTYNKDCLNEVIEYGMKSLELVNSNPRQYDHNDWATTLTIKDIVEAHISNGSYEEAEKLIDRYDEKLSNQFFLLSQFLLFKNTRDTDKLYEVLKLYETISTEEHPFLDQCNYFYMKGTYEYLTNDIDSIKLTLDDFSSLVEKDNASQRFYDEIEILYNLMAENDKEVIILFDKFVNNYWHVYYSLAGNWLLNEFEQHDVLIETKNYENKILEIELKSNTYTPFNYDPDYIIEIEQ